MLLFQKCPTDVHISSCPLCYKEQNWAWGTPCLFKSHQLLHPALCSFHSKWSIFFLGNHSYSCNPSFCRESPSWLRWLGWEPWDSLDFSCIIAKCYLNPCSWQRAWGIHLRSWRGAAEIPRLSAVGQGNRGFWLLHQSAGKPLQYNECQALSKDLLKTRLEGWLWSVLISTKIPFKTNCQALSALKTSAFGKRLIDTFLKLLYSKPEVTAEINQSLLLCDQTTFQASFDRLTCLFPVRRGIVILNSYWFPFLVADRTINLVHKCTHQVTSCVKVMGMSVSENLRGKRSSPRWAGVLQLFGSSRRQPLGRMLHCGVFMRNKQRKCDAPNEYGFLFFQRNASCIAG